MKFGEIAVTRELHIAAPEGDAVYTGAVYAGLDGHELIESVRHEAMRINPDGSKNYFTKHAYLRCSRDNGRTWIKGAEERRDFSDNLAGTHRFPLALIAHPTRQLLIRLFSTHEELANQPLMGIGNQSQRTMRTFYSLSRDCGKTWTEPRQVIDARPGFDEQQWGPDFLYGHCGGVGEGQPVFLPDGTMVMGFAAMRPEAPPQDKTPRSRECYITTVFAQARLKPDAPLIDWRFGEHIAVEFPKACGGCCETATLHLGGNRVFTTMRCQGDAQTGINSTRYCALSEDAGLTWTTPEPLKYDDGTVLWTPASVHRFFVSSKTGKTYLLANILPGPVHGQAPRYPLALAEFDPKRLCVLRKTVQTIQDLPPGAPIERRYTNFGAYEERETKDLILTMPEQPKLMDFSAMKRPEDYTADCIRFRVRLPMPPEGRS